jgi:hypothetical protein
MPLVDRWLQRRAEKRVGRAYAKQFVTHRRLLTPEEEAAIRAHLLRRDQSLLERLRDE